MNKLISTIAKNSIDEIRVELSEFKGYDLIGMRIYTEIENTKDKVPTKRGICANVKLLPELREALQRAETEAMQAGLL